VIPVPWIIAGVTGLIGLGGAGIAVYQAVAAPDAPGKDEDPGGEIGGRPVGDAEELALQTIYTISRSSTAGCAPLALQWLQLYRVHADKLAEGKAGLLGISSANRASRLARLAREIATCTGPVDMRRFGWERVGEFTQAVGAAVADAGKGVGDARSSRRSGSRESSA